MSDSFKKCHNSALRLLSYRPRSEAELRTKLQQKFDAKTIDCVITDLKAKLLIDDVAFASFWRDNRMNLNPRSKRILSMELRSKGISAGAIDDTLAEVDDEESAYRVAVKKSKALSQCDYDNFRRRLGAILSRRGYNYGVVDRTVRCIYEEYKKRLDLQ